MTEYMVLDAALRDARRILEARPGQTLAEAAEAAMSATRWARENLRDMEILSPADVPAALLMNNIRLTTFGDVLASLASAWRGRCIALSGGIEEARAALEKTPNAPDAALRSLDEALQKAEAVDVETPTQLLEALLRVPERSANAHERRKNDRQT